MKTKYRYSIIKFLIVTGLVLFMGFGLSIPHATAASANVNPVGLTIIVPQNWTAIHIGRGPVPIYTDATTTKLSGTSLTESYSDWHVVRAAIDANRKVAAYDLGANQWIKAAGTSPSFGSNLQAYAMWQGTAVYSDFKDVTIYSDMRATKPIGKLSTQYDEWAVTQVAKDDYGPFSYNLGGNQWVKSTDISVAKSVSGVIILPAGTIIQSAVGNYTKTITTPGAYKVFSVGYIKGQQALSVGDFNNWVLASAGAYYPA
ncbi:MAG: hypothetical protein LKF36_13745 [Lactobacillus sp.]|jgi:hypothetical protein|nr:hypothetical protein [Lactobacillus sp.]